MINKEVVVFQIEDMLSNINKENLLSFGGHIDNGAAFLELMTNVLTLLKEKEAVKPRVSSVEQRCGNCNKVIEMDGWIACPWCGKPIDWEGWWKKNGTRNQDT